MVLVQPLPYLLSKRQLHACVDRCGRVTTDAGHARHLQQSPSFVKSLRLQKQLQKHTGCVNTVSWSDDGSLLVSGSDDCDLNIWKWEQNLSLVHNLHSGHTSNIFCAKFVPCTSNSLIVSCALDGNVRLTDVQANVVHCVVNYPQRVHKVAFLPQSPKVFLTAGSDGTVRLFDLREKPDRRIQRTDTSNIVVDLRAQSGRQSIDINALSVHPLHGHLLALGGGDEFLRVADLRKAGSGRATASPVSATCVARFCPDHLTSGPFLLQSPHITGCQYDVFGNRIVATYSGDDIFVFDATGVEPIMPLNRGTDMSQLAGTLPIPADVSKQENEEEDGGPYGHDWFGRSNEKDTSIKNDLRERQLQGQVSSPILQRLTGHRNEDTVKEVTFYGVDSEFIASGSDCGNIFIWDSRTSRIVNILKDADSRTINCIASNPHDVTVLATCGIDDDVKIWSPDGMQGTGVNAKDIEEMVSYNQKERETTSPRLTARQVLQLFLERGVGDSNFLEMVGWNVQNEEQESDEETDKDAHTDMSDDDGSEDSEEDDDSASDTDATTGSAG